MNNETTKEIKRLQVQGKLKFVRFYTCHQCDNCNGFECGRVVAKALKAGELATVFSVDARELANTLSR